MYAIPKGWQNPGGKEVCTLYVSMDDLYINDIKDTLKRGDGFAVFGTVLGQEKCLAYKFVDNDSDTMNVIVRADTLSVVTNLKFKFWSVDSSCVRVMKYTNANPLEDSTTIIIPSLSFYDTPQIYYPKDSLLANETSLLPLLSEITDSISFTATNGLSIDPNTGNINAKLTGGANTYIVSVHTELCYYGDDIKIVIQDTVDTRPKLDSMKVQFTLVPPTCDTKGSIVYDGTGAPTGTQFVLQEIDNESNKQSSTTGNFNNIKDGVYQIKLSYEWTSFTYKETFVLSAAKGCNNPVLNFSDPSGAPPAIYLEKPGVVQIFNRDGKLIKTLQAPAHWNGTDQSGNDVPMGDYYLYLNENKEQTITILR